MINIIAPGIPKIPTKIDVMILSPIVNHQIPPIKLIIKINNPPSTVFINNFNIFLIGNKNIFPIIRIATAHPAIVNILYISKFLTSSNKIYSKHFINILEFDTY